VKEILTPKGLLALEDVQALEPDRWDNLLERLGSANLEDLYAAAGGGAIRVEELDEALDDLKINKSELGWTTISITGSGQSHRPGVLARMAGLVSQFSGNIIRSVSNTRSDGGYTLRLVVKDLDSKKESLLREAYRESEEDFDTMEMV
jgi:GTP pyrophosphokinase